MAADPVVITGIARTPMGGLLGSRSGFTASQLGAYAIKAAVERSGLKPDDVQEVLMGFVLPAGQGQAPARPASRGAGPPDSVVCATANKAIGKATVRTPVPNAQIVCRLLLEQTT